MLSASANGGITLTNASNHVGAFSATVYGSGNIALTNIVTSASWRWGH
jgi:hypothetical protein